MQRLIAELRQSGIADEKVLAAIGNVDRERFVTPAFAERAWENTALPIAFGQTRIEPGIPGSDVRLTIDRYIQRLIENELEFQMKAHTASGGSLAWPRSWPTASAT